MQTELWGISVKKILIFVFVSLIVYSIIRYLSHPLDSFQSNSATWSPETIDKFKDYQKTTFQNTYQFNMDTLQKQASEQDAEYLVKNKHWEWSDETKQLYLDAIAQNPMVRILPQESLDNVMKVYNENAMRQILSWNTKEGDFLLTGITVMNQNQTMNVRDNFARELEPDMSIRCDGAKGMIWSGNNKKINNEDLPATIPGFEFRDKVCNPCVALRDEPNYSCPFSLKIDGDKSVSAVWKSFWSSSFSS